MPSFKHFLRANKPIVAMIHVAALPGTPNNQLSPNEIIKKSLGEAEIYKNCGIKVLMIENMHDTPYLKGKVGHEISSLMSIVGYEIKRQTGLYCGIQLLAAANKEALASAHSAGLDFIRAEGFVFGHLADEGLIESSAAELLRYRKAIGAEDILVFTDIKKKHSSHAISHDTSIAEHAKAAEFFLSDGLIVTGKSTGEQTDLTELQDVKKATKLPVFIGSGLTSENIKHYYSFADGFIVGSSIKHDGNWQNPPDPDRVKRLVEEISLLNC